MVSAVWRNWQIIYFCYIIGNTLGARGFIREEPRCAINEARSSEERENRQEVRKPLVTHDS